MLLSDKYPFLTDYFNKLLSSEKHPLPQSILFYGNDLESQYTLAKEIARLLNCKSDKADNCECLNCKWIREDSHPAIITVSRLDNKPEDDDSKTVISVKQSTLIKETLMNSSEFHRVFIFCNRDDNGNIAGLNQQNFQAETANSLLKIIEEPQPGVTFIFLTRYIDDLLSTIISRSQCFFVPARKSEQKDFSIVNSVFANYWDFDRKDLFDVSQRLQELSKEIDINEILDCIQEYILWTLKNNSRQTELINHIKIIEESKKQAKLGIRTQNIFDDLCLKLIK